MLDLLHIENIAVIEKADIEFGAGLNVLTGETGAGKSIIIDALSALLGSRVTRELVRAGCSAALVSAQFSLSASIEKWLADNDLPPGEDGVLLISRRISEDGKSVCRINGSLSTVAQLRSLGLLIADIHGQNDGAGLQRESTHLGCLDEFAGLKTQRDAYSGLYHSYISCRAELETAKSNELGKELKMQALKTMISELEEASVKEGEWELLNDRRDLLRNAGKLKKRIDAAYNAMYGDDNNDGALALIDTALAEIELASRVTESLSGLAQNLEDLRYRAEDITDTLSSYKNSMDFSPGELERTEARLELLSRLQRRYGNLDELELKVRTAKNELEDTEYLSERIVKLENDLSIYEKRAFEAALGLSKMRKEAAHRLQILIEDELNSLSMPGARFEVNFKDKAMDSSGVDDVCFLLSTNAGEPAGRLSRIASGGELSRIMLAIKTVLSSSDEADVLVFDEIDSGVSGIAAQRVAEKLSDISSGKQVLCVTHLPQIAVMSDYQYLIEKKEHAGRTYTDVHLLNNAQREKAIARLVGGDNITETTIKSAAELIRSASAYKERNK